MDKAFERLFTMDDAVWARHAGGWSVWTRVATLLLLLALWSHAWIGCGRSRPCRPAGFR